MKLMNTRSSKELFIRDDHDNRKTKKKLND